MLVQDRSKASDNYLAKLLEEYRSTHGELPHNMDFVSEWALNNKKIQPSRRSAIKDISRLLSARLDTSIIAIRRVVECGPTMRRSTSA